MIRYLEFLYHYLIIVPDEIIKNRTKLLQSSYIIFAPLVSVIILGILFLVSILLIGYSILFLIIWPDKFFALVKDKIENNIDEESYQNIKKEISKLKV